MSTRRLAALTLSALLCLSASACGSSDSDGGSAAADKSTTTAAPAAGGDLDKAGFLKAADKICKDSTDKINKETEGQSSEEFTDAAFEEFLKMAATESIKQIAAVRALGFPADDAKALDEAFSTFETAFKGVQEDPSKALQLTADPAFNKASTFLTDYGFKECGGSGA